MDSSIIIDIADILAKNKDPQNLNLEGLNIGPRSAGILSKYLIKIRNVYILNLSNNSLSSIGARAISLSLEVNSSIKIIDFCILN